MQVLINSQGVIRSLYSDSLQLAALGPLQITRASHVEPDREGRWWADLAPVIGPLLGPFSLRSEALLAEQQWLEAHRLAAAS